MGFCTIVNFYTGFSLDRGWVWRVVDTVQLIGGEGGQLDLLILNFLHRLIIVVCKYYELLS